jgi:hypothetical protein
MGFVRSCQQRLSRVDVLEPSTKNRNFPHMPLFELCENICCETIDATSEGLVNDAVDP